MTSKTWMGPILLILLGGGVAFAQAGPPKTAPKASPPAPAPSSTSGQGQGMMGSGMMGPGMMGSGMMESCSCSSATGIHVDVKKVAKGVTITYTSDDASTVTRLQKRAEAVRLMHESCGQ